MLPLFHKFSELKENLPWKSLGIFPTPILNGENLGKEIGVESLFVKHDGMTHKTFGGNKIRKLEFHIGKALKDNLKEVMTFGGVGSNHATATAVCAHQVGLRSISMLMPQANSMSLRRNLKMSLYHGAEFHLYNTTEELEEGKKEQMEIHREKTGKTPLEIPFGGSNPLGLTGFVNAAFELKEQIDNGEMPEPDFIYTAVGTMGTAIGLTIGLKILGMKTKVIPVRVIDKEVANEDLFMKLFNETTAFLKENSPSFPDVKITKDEIGMRHDFFGEEYAKFTPEGIEAIKLIKETMGIKLEGTYTGKALACLVSDARKGKLKNKTVLFWNTYNANDFPDNIINQNYKNLPREFHRYFEEEVQVM